jgi:UDP-2,3-diacylglucosamine pyrophosphatase LpxH
VRKDHLEEKDVHLGVKAKSMDDFLEFIQTENPSKVEIKNTLF